ncbi:MAG: L,D-transpeptidase family protein [Paracoccaceae bacterium]|nr:L,D-transpeptidase family protein [Paracoccaceae bacterium]
MTVLKVLPALLVALVLAGCAPRVVTYDGPEVTRIVVHKEARKMYLLHHDRALKTYDIDLGFEPDGHKRKSGDGKTPEGTYIIDRRNPDSIFHLSLGISYPNARDVAVARRLGVDPGGEIFIHGESPLGSLRGPDWTWGCIAVTNEEMEEIYVMVRTGTPITIYP